jgi:hypothetical protein
MSGSSFLFVLLAVARQKKPENNELGQCKATALRSKGPVLGKPESG